MNEPQINQKFKELLPALSEEEYRQLEENILSEGVREAIKVWQGQIVDGHNRFAICQKHDLPYPVMDMFFADEDEALEWIIQNQLGRRNITRNQWTYFIGELYEIRKKRRGGNGSNQYQSKSNSAEVAEKQNDLVIEYDEGVKPVKVVTQTAQQIAAEKGVSARTVEQAASVHKAIQVLPKETKSDFLAGKISQKQVIEKAKKINEPKEEVIDNRNDDFTNLAKHYGNGFVQRLRDLKEYVDKAEKSFKMRGMKFKEYGENILSLDLSVALQDAVSLRNVLKCGYCRASGCDLCKAGYVIEGEEK